MKRKIPIVALVDGATLKIGEVEVEEDWSITGYISPLLAETLNLEGQLGSFAANPGTDWETVYPQNRGCGDPSKRSPLK